MLHSHKRGEIMHKRGQVTYEYIVVIAMVLILITPFFYSFILTTTTSLGRQVNQDLVTRVAQTTKTVENLGGVGTKLMVPVRMYRVQTNSLTQGSSTITITDARGEKHHAEAAPNVYAGVDGIYGNGLQKIPVVKTYLDAIVVGRAPTIVGTCPENINYPTANQCDVSVATNEDYQLIGANLKDVTLVVADKISNQAELPPVIPSCEIPECSSDDDCSGNNYCIAETCQCSDATPALVAPLDEGESSDADLRLTVSNSGTGKGTYMLSVRVEDPEQGTLESNTQTLIITSAGGGDDDDEEEDDD